MFRIIETTTFSQWIDDLRDMQAKARIVYRIRNAALGHLGDIKSLGDGVLKVLEFNVIYTLKTITYAIF